MAKRKKHPKLPNGFGSIKYLGKGRRNPYAVHPPTEEFTVDGVPITPKAIAYVNDWYVGFSILLAYKAGTYVPGTIPKLGIPKNNDEMNPLIQDILSNYNTLQKVDFNAVEEKTFSKVYEEFFTYKFKTDQSRTYSESTMRSTRAAYLNLKALHECIFANLRHSDLQSALNSCPLKYSSLELMRSLLHQMYEYAIIHEIIDKDYSAHIKITRPDDDEHGLPFTDEELKVLWNNTENDVVEFILIMCYSGFRIKAYETIEVNLTENYFQGGVKNSSSKDRIVPIHSSIIPLIKRRIDKDGKLLVISPVTFRLHMYNTLEHYGISKHTPHDCRHTFSSLCEKYNVNENDRKRMLGHSFKNDITNSIYGHRTVKDLKAEIEKIKVCY